MKYFSMFSGIGGFEIGIERGVGLSRIEKREIQSKDERFMSNTSSKDGFRWEQHPLCIGYSEIDKYASAVYRYRFGKEVKNYGNATEIKAEELPDFDLLVGGFPCQAFSIAGKRGGFEDTRGTLFFEIARVLKAKQPRMFLLENVKGILNHDKGNSFTKILQTIDELGYNAEWQVLNSKHFGVPQNRERVFIVGHLRGTGGRKVFPIGTTNQKDIVQINNPNHSNDRIYSKEGISPTLNTMQGGNRQPFVSLPKIRRLTPIECERLQGFPDEWTKYGEFDDEVKPISDTQRYKMCGNAVTVNVIEAIITSMFK